MSDEKLYDFDKKEYLSKVEEEPNQSMIDRLVEEIAYSKEYELHELTSLLNNLLNVVGCKWLIEEVFSAYQVSLVNHKQNKSVYLKIFENREELEREMKFLLMIRNGE